MMMLKFDPLRFIADHAGMALAEAIAEAYKQGQQDAQPEQCKDAVSKAKVLETYADLYDVFDDNKGIQNELHKVFDRINALPSALPEPRQEDEHDE